MANPPPRRQKRGNQTMERVMRFIRAFIRENRYAPSRREIGAGTGIKSTAHVNHVLGKLREDGRITYVPGVPRTLVVTEDDNKEEVQHGQDT